MATRKEVKNRISSVKNIHKITRAMELMAAARVVKAQEAVRESSPYARALTRAVSAVATFSNEEHPLTSEKEDVKRAAVVIITSDRGLAGGFNSNVVRRAQRFLVENGDRFRRIDIKGEVMQGDDPANKQVPLILSDVWYGR